MYPAVSMAGDFKYDAFLSYSSKDVDVVRELAERLRADDVRVWFDEWVVKAGAHVSDVIEKGLEQSRVLVFCMSENGFGSKWARLESGTFRFRDPLNEELRFIPLKLDDVQVPVPLAPFAFIDWREDKREEEYPRLLEACRPGTPPVVRKPAVKREETRPVPPLSKQLVTYVLGLILGFVIGRFVFPLLELVPPSLQRELVAPSSALMAIIAVAIQFYGYRRWSDSDLAPYFKHTLIAVVVAVLLFLVVHTFTTVTIETTPGNSMSFVIGFTRPLREPCPAGVSDADCIKRLSSDLAEIASFWGDGRIRTATLALKLSYLIAASGLGALVGLLLLARRRS
jgi:TIR domain